jgi:hypothetical protein
MLSSPSYPKDGGDVEFDGSEYGDVKSDYEDPVTGSGTQEELTDL